MQPDFRLSQKALDDGSVVIAVRGDLDLATAPQLRSLIGEQMGLGCRHVVVDFASADFIDSSGMGVLLWAARRLRSAGGDLVAVNVAGAVDRTFALAHIGDVIPVSHPGTSPPV